MDAEKKLHTLNAHVGRQTWAFDPNASEKDIEKQNQRRKEFRENRFVQKHSKDALMRDAFDARRVERKRERERERGGGGGENDAERGRDRWTNSRWRRKRNGRSKRAWSITKDNSIQMDTGRRITEDRCFSCLD